MAAEEASAQGSSSDPGAVSNAPTKPKRLQAIFAYFQLLFYADPTWLDVFLVVTGTITAAASATPFPIMGILFGQLLDDLNTASCEIEEGNNESAAGIQDAVNDKVKILVAMAFANFALIYIYTVSWSIFSRRLETRLRDRYFRTLLRQDATFYDKRQAGELATRLNADIQAVQSGTSEKVGVCIACSSFFITSYIVAFTQNWKLAAMLIALIPAFLVLAGVGSRFTQKFTEAMSNGLVSASSIAQETLSHIAVVQAFSAGPRLEAKFASYMSRAQSQGIKKACTAGLQSGILYFIAYSANALAFWQGSVQIAKSVEDGGNGTSVGKIYTVIFLLVDACIILGSIAPILPLLGSATSSFLKLREDMESTSSIDSASDAGLKLHCPIEGSVSFHDVSFAYVSRPDNPVLNKVSFDCPAGKHTALVGLSGSGKSTVAGLTARLYDPTEGTVTLDGHNLKDLNVKNLRSFMSLVQQEPSLLDRSILENIALGLVNSPQASHQKYESVLLSSAMSEIAAKVRDGHDLKRASEEFESDAAELVGLVQHAASLADASSFIERLELGYGTLVGTGGKLVSGGQRQRIALARALIRDPQILILDEATASLDSASEHRIQMAIESIAKGRTVIAIAHRLSTIKNADNIIVMSQGKIIEQGNHLELMALNGSYAGMVRLQNLDSDNEATPSSSNSIKGDAEIHVSENDSITNEKQEHKGDAEKASANEPVEVPEPDDPGKELDENKEAGTVVKNIARMVRPNVHYFIIALVAAAMVGATFSASGLIFGHTVGHLNPCNSPNEIAWAGRFFGGMFFMLAVVELFANSISWSGFGIVAERLLYRMRVLSFRSLYEQGLDWHQSGGRNPTTLLSLVTSDTAAVGAFSGSIIGTMFGVVVNFLIALILSHIVAWKIAIVCLVSVPLLLISGIMQIRALTQFERKHAGAFANATGITVEAVNSFKTVSSLSLEQELMGSYRRALKAPRKEITLAAAYANIFLAIANSAGGLVYSFAYWWGSTRITKGEYNQTQFFIVLVAMLVGAQLWGQMFSLAPEVTRAKAAASRILSLLDLGSSGQLSRKNIDLDQGRDNEKDPEAVGSSAPKLVSNSDRGATVTFKDVGFSYPARPHIPVLKDMSFTIQNGQFCGLVGPSGAGKSTIMSLVQRMYAPSSGTVEIDGMPISHSGTDFRDDIAVVPQDCALFDGTIKFNVGLGARTGEEASQEDIEAACKLANIHDTVCTLPDKYDTECGPNGSRLSGGQRQRLAIARALVRKPRLLLLDESTSALDAESERALQEGLEQAARGITVIAITHRLHTVRKADVIFVVEGGKVVEKGRHEELVERSETYRINALQQMLGS